MEFLNYIGRSDAVFSSIQGDYPVEFSCLKRLVSSLNPYNVKVNEVRIKDLLNEKLVCTTPPIPNEFCKSVGLTSSIIIGAIYAYLAVKNDRYFKYTLENTTVDLNTMAWMMYHGTDLSQYRHAFDVKHFRRDQNSCNICNARQNFDVHVIGDTSYRATISPEVMTGGRMKMSYNYEITGGFHYVLWSECHDLPIDFIEIRDYLKGKEFFWHGSCRFGHAHIHLMKGEIINIRAKELCLISQRAVNEDQMLYLNDFYHPMSTYLELCSIEGKGYLAMAIAIQLTRIKLPVDIDIISVTYQASYEHMLVAIVDEIYLFSTEDNLNFPQKVNFIVKSAHCDQDRAVDALEFSKGDYVAATAFLLSQT